MTKNTLTVTAAALAVLVAQHARSDDLTHKPKVGETLIIPAIYSKMLGCRAWVDLKYIYLDWKLDDPSNRAREARFNERVAQGQCTWMPLDTDLVVQEVSPETKTACVRPPAMSGCFWILAVPLETRDPQAK